MSIGRTLRPLPLSVAALWSLLLIILSLTPAAAHDFTGIYVYASASEVAYLSITDTGGTFIGYLQTVSADGTSRDGVARHTSNFRGFSSGTHVVLVVNESVISSGGRWTAESTWNGLSLAIPQASGQIGEYPFQRSSIAEVNGLIAELSRNAAQAKASNDATVARASYFANVGSELGRAQRQLDSDLNSRPAAIAALAKAKVEVGNALTGKRAAEADVARLQAIAAQKRTDADKAKATAITNEQISAANDLGYNANQAGYDVNAAGYKVQSIQYTLNGAERDLVTAKGELARFDARIVNMRAVIARDQQILHNHWGN